MAESLDRAAAAATLPRHANGAPEASGAADTNVPRPTWPRTRPRVSRSRYALTTVVRLTFSARASSRSAGSRKSSVSVAGGDAAFDGVRDMTVHRPRARQPGRRQPERAKLADLRAVVDRLSVDGGASGRAVAVFLLRMGSCLQGQAEPPDDGRVAVVRPNDGEPSVRSRGASRHGSRSSQARDSSVKACRSRRCPRAPVRRWYDET